MAGEVRPERVIAAVVIGSVSTVLWVTERGRPVLARPGPVALWIALVIVASVGMWGLSAVIPSLARRGAQLVLLVSVVLCQVVAVPTEWVVVPAGMLICGMGAATIVAVAPGQIGDRCGDLQRGILQALVRLGSSFGLRPPADGPGGARSRWAAVGVAVALGLVVSARDLRWVLYDDAAITLRYSWRISEGFGFTYNDGDRTNGASAPLYTLVLAAAHSAGADLVVTAKVLGVVAYSAVLGLVAAIVGRVARLGTIILAVGLVLASAGFREQALSGMESGCAVVLGLLAVALILDDHDGWAGVALGLAVVNKLDGLLLLAAVLVTTWIVRRRFAWRMPLTVAAVCLPWFVFSQWYFGSPLPYSMTQKLTVVGDPASGFDPTWMLRTLVSDGQVLVVLGAVATTAWAMIRRVGGERVRLAAGTTGLWFLAHMAAFSLIDLGDAYPWYVAVLYPTAVVAAAIGFAAVQDLLAPSGGRGEVEILMLRFTAVVVVVVPAMAGLFVVGATVRDGHHPDAYEQFDATRREAGRFLGRSAAAGEVVETCWGWVAFGAPTNPIRETCPLSTRKAVAEPTWIVWSSWLSRAEPGVEDAVVAVTFDSCADPPGSTSLLLHPGDPRIREDPAAGRCVDGS